MNPQISVTLASAMMVKPYVQTMFVMQRLSLKNAHTKEKHTKRVKDLSLVMGVIRVDV